MDVPMVMVECCNCHMPFAMTTELNAALRRCHNTFYCPKGHAQFYVVKSDIEQLREERDRAINMKLAVQAELEELKKKKHKKRKKGG